MTEIPLNHLDIDWPANLYPDEVTLDDLNHPIFDWVKNSGLDAVFQIRWQEVQDDGGTWDHIWSTDPRLYAVFDHDADATAFVLAWDGGEI